ncbi:MAG: DUF4390 domain-containing protein [Desulfovibrionaceae bacterium]|nr:DUF4390 domain-containing protein [Desulfovibrionaceae bacterium]
MPAGRAALVLALVLALAAWAAPGLCQSLNLRDLVVDNQAGTLTARFGVLVGGAKEVAESLEDGAVLALTCQARLYQRRDYWLDGLRAENTFVSRLRLDSLTREFVLDIPGREAPLKNKDLEALLAEGWSDIGLSLGPWNALRHGASYSLGLDVKLNQADIPNWFKRLLFFWSWDVIPATSYKLDFKY